MELKPEMRKTSATIVCMEQKASVAAVPLLALTIVRMTRRPAELMYAAKVHHDLFGPGVQERAAGFLENIGRGRVHPPRQREDAHASTLFGLHLHIFPPLFYL